MRLDPAGEPLWLGETYREQGLIIKAYEQCVFRLREDLGGAPDDARTVMLSNMAMPAGFCVGLYNLLDAGVQRGPTFLGAALGLTSPDFVGVAAEDLARGARLFLVLESQFQIENGLRNVLRALAPSNQATRFWQIARDVLDRCGLPDQEAKRAILSVPAAIRNCLHANGVHTEASHAVTIEGVAYRFEQGRPVACGRLEHIVHALGGSLGVIREILTCAAVRAQARIDDAYVRDVRTRAAGPPSRPGEGPDEDLYAARLALLRTAEAVAGTEFITGDDRQLGPDQLGLAVYADALRSHEAQLRALGRVEVRYHEVAHRGALLERRKQALRQETEQLERDEEAFRRDLRAMREDLWEQFAYWQSHVEGSSSNQRLPPRSDESAEPPHIE